MGTLSPRNGNGIRSVIIVNKSIQALAKTDLLYIEVKTSKTGGRRGIRKETAKQKNNSDPKHFVSSFNNYRIASSKRSVYIMHTLLLRKLCHF